MNDDEIEPWEHPIFSEERDWPDFWNLHPASLFASLLLFALEEFGVLEGSSELHAAKWLLLGIGCFVIFSWLSLFWMLHMWSNEYEQKTVVELKEILRKRGLKVSGNKADLIARLREDEEE